MVAENPQPQINREHQLRQIQLNRRCWKSCCHLPLVLFAMFMCLIPADPSMAADSANIFKPFQHFRDCDMCSEMVVLPAGEFMMGATDEDFKGNEQYRYMLEMETPRHLVHVNSFAIAKFDVTRAQFAQFARETGFEDKGCEIFGDVLGTMRWYKSTLADWQNPGFKQTGQDPVVCVSWNDAQKYITWLKY